MYNINFYFLKNNIKKRLNKKSYKIKKLHKIIDDIGKRKERIEAVKNYNLKIMSLAIKNKDDKLYYYVKKNFLKNADRHFKLNLLQNHYFNKLLILINTDTAGGDYDV